jgi:two-component system KDP operon response regulator KdpE
MAASAASLEAAGRPVTPDELLREVVPDQPVLLIGPAPAWEASGVTGWLEASGWSWTHAPDAERGRWLASIQKVALVMVAGDDADVWAIVEATRPITMAPMVVLANPSSSSVCSLVRVGVDAVVDPASGAEEVFARVVALLRRSDHGWEPGVRHLQAGDLRVDLWTQECDLDGHALHLSPTEYALLTFLMTHPQQVLPTNTIVRRVWGWIPSDGRNTLRIFVNRVRRKLGDDPRQPRYISSVRGTGYRFIANVAQMGDEAEASHPRADVGPLLGSVEDLAVALAGCRDIDSAADALLETLDAVGYADGIALFRVEDVTMRLVASRRMPKRWLASVEPGVPITSTYASGQSMLTREAVQFGDIRHQAETFAGSVERLAFAGHRACLFLPIVCDASVWGHVGLGRRARQPFDPTGTAYVRAACAVFALRVATLPPG